MATPQMSFQSFGSLGCEIKAQVLLNQVQFHKMKMIQEDRNGRWSDETRKELKRNQNLLNQQSA